jgi:hypothetical protein
MTVDRAQFGITFNSLFRDHTTPLEGLRPDVRETFNSLFRDHTNKNIYECCDIWSRVSFNSLFRDHRARFRDFSALRGFLPRRPFAQMIPKATIWIYRFAPL